MDYLQIPRAKETSKASTFQKDSLDSGKTESEELVEQIRKHEEDVEQLKKAQTELEDELDVSDHGDDVTIDYLSLEEKAEMDGRSIYVGNVDYGSTASDLAAYFHACGPVNRVTILTDKYSGHPKGFAYVEFASKESARSAAELDQSFFHGRKIKVCPKRTNRPGMSTTDRPPRGRSGRGRNRVVVQYVYPGDFRQNGILSTKFRRRGFAIPPLF